MLKNKCDCHFETVKGRNFKPKIEFDIDLVYPASVVITTQLIFIKNGAPLKKCNR